MPVGCLLLLTQLYNYILDEYGGGRIRYALVQQQLCPKAGLLYFMFVIDMFLSSTNLISCIVVHTRTKNQERNSRQQQLYTVEWQRGGEKRKEYETLSDQTKVMINLCLPFVPTNNIVVVEYGGVLVKYIGDGKQHCQGCYLLSTTIAYKSRNPLR